MVWTYGVGLADTDDGPGYALRTPNPTAVGAGDPPVGARPTTGANPEHGSGRATFPPEPVS
jgi:hypothetical protein